MAEVILFGEPMTLFIGQEYGTLKNVTTFKKALAGAELNVCIGLTRLEHSTTYITKLGGKDPFGEYIYESLQNKSIDTSNVSFDEEYATGFMLKSKVSKGNPDISYFRKNSAASHISPEDIEKVSFENVRHVHVTGIPCALSESCLAASLRLIERAHEHHVYVSFDPNLRPSLWKSREIMAKTLNDISCRCDMVLPGLSEGETLTGLHNAQDIADYYLSKGVTDVVIKTGKEGAYIRNAETCAQVPCFPVEKFSKVVDTVGAGDGFAVGVISGRLEGLPLKDAVMRGNIIGGLQLTVEGDNEGLPDRRQLAEAMTHLVAD
jgi:2-dehydro-3-deoxygluconokinase